MPAALVATYDAGAINVASVSSWTISGLSLSVGDVVTVGVMYGGLGTATNRTITAADNLGNSYAEITLGTQWDSGNSTGLRIFRTLVTAAGTATITFTPSANCDFTTAIAYVWSGGSANEDGATSAITITATPDSGSITTTAAGDIVVGFLANTSSASGTITANNGSFTNTRNVSGGGFCAQSFIQSAAGSVNSAPTMSVSNKWISAIVSIKAGASNATLSAPTATSVTATAATLGATTDQTSGTFYAVVDSAANLSGVTATQIKAGQKASGSAALAANSAAVSTTTPSAGVTGLTAGTLYSYAAVQNNSNGDSNVVTGTFTTAAATPTLDQSHFRWRNDDGSETTATWAAAEDTNVTIAALTPTRLRVEIAATNNPASKAYKLQYRKVGDSTWRDIN